MEKQTEDIMDLCVRVKVGEWINNLPDALDIRRDCDHRMAYQMLLAEFGRLTRREQQMIALRFGFTKERDVGFKRIAEAFGISVYTARSINDKALRKLRHPDTTRKLRAVMRERILYA